MRLMEMYRRFTDHASNVSSTENSLYDNHGTNTGNNNTRFKRRLIPNHLNSIMSSLDFDYTRKMNTLFIFPDTSDVIRHLAQITQDLPMISQKVKWPNEHTMSEINADAFDVIVIDYWHYKRKDGLLIKLINLLKTNNSNNPSFALVAYMNQTIEHYAIIAQAGFAEMWFNYKPNVAIRNAIMGYINNQFQMTNMLRNSEILLTILNELGESIEILDHKFQVKLKHNPNKTNKLAVETTSVATNSTVSDKLAKRNWFQLNQINETIETELLKTMKNSNFWEGIIAFPKKQVAINTRSAPMSLNEQKNKRSSNFFTTIKKLEYRKNSLYFISKVKVTGPNIADWSHAGHSKDTLMTTAKQPDFNKTLISIDSPILQVLKLINSIQEFCSPLVKYHLHTVIDILNSKDLFNTTVDAIKTDRVTSNLVEGLLASNTSMYSQTQTRRQSTGVTKRRITRNNSEIIHDHISQVLARAGKVTDIPENGELSNIDQLLERYSRWDFNIFELEILTEKKPLRFLGMKVFNQFNVGSTLKIDSKLFNNWLEIIETNYTSTNCYHNSTHAADVLQSSVYFLETKKINEIFDQFDDAAAIVAAIIHDLGHPGRTNPFLINSSHDLAVFYNDIAVLENHHASFAFKLTLKDDRINIFKNLNRDDLLAFRHAVIESVLATEMAKHFEHLTKFINTVIRTPDQTKLTSDVTKPPEPPIDLTTNENKSLIRRMLIKCSDVNNPSRPFKFCEEWARRISEEYFEQTDEEMRRDLPVVMPHFNRSTCNVPRSQISFIELFLEEMFKNWCEFVGCQELINNLKVNKDNWKELIGPEPDENQPAN